VLDLAAELLDRLRDGGLRELEVRHGTVRVKVSAAPTTPVIADPGSPAAPATLVPERSAAPVPSAAKTVAAPLTGIFYRSPSPQAGPFVQAGSVVNVGDVVGLIEAMKLFNEVRSTVAGRVRRIVAESGQLVRAHQPLVELE
jgi:acetyl-CoA carboxylase biotin carboxyl carrier protein